MPNSRPGTIFGTPARDLLEQMRGHYQISRDFLANLATTGDEWTVVQDGTAGLTASAAAGGWLSVATDAGTDNNETYAKMPSAVAFAAGLPVYIAFSMKLTEANVDDANIILGLSSTGAANTLQDNGAGPPANYDGAVFFKVDGGTVWQTETSHTTTQQTTASANAFASATVYELAIFWNGADTVQFFVNGTGVASHTTAGALPTAVMGITLGVKNGFSNIEALLVDWFILDGARIADASNTAGIGQTPVT